MRVKDALEAIGSIVANLVLAIRGASAITLIAAALVLGGALAAGHRHRVYDAVILKTLGATRRHLISAYAIEYLLIGSATALFGVIGGSLAAWLIVVAAYASAVYLAALAGAGGSGRAQSWLPSRSGWPAPYGARPETGAGAAESLVFATFRRVRACTCRLAVWAIFGRLGR